MNDTPLASKQSLPLNDGIKWWEKESLTARIPALKVRSELFIAIRQYFNRRRFYEVDTPCLQVSPGMEPNLTAFSTDLFEPFFEREKKKLYLQASPEFAMKKLLCGGMEKIFQFARVWRNGERSNIHHPEFTMLEWYRTGADWKDIAKECEDLFRKVVVNFQQNNSSIIFEWKGLKCDPLGKWQYLSVADAFDQYCGIDILNTAPEPLKPDGNLLSIEAKKIDVRVDKGDQWSEIFYRIFLEKVEPHLGVGAPTVLYDWPLAMAALAQQSPVDNRVAERFEVFACGIELANGFGELTDAGEQRQRFENEIRQKEEIKGYSYPIDDDFINALEAGMPKASGIALGFDRLVMLCAKAQKIEEILWAPVVNAIK